MVVHGDGQDTLGGGLPDDIFVQLCNDFARRGNLAEELLAATTKSLFLLKNRLAQLNTFATDVDVTWTFHQWSNVAIAFAAKRTKGVLLARCATAA